MSSLLSAFLVSCGFIFAAELGDEHGLDATGGDIPDVGTFDFGADADAAGADDAHLRVELEVGVGAVRLRRGRLVVGAGLADPRLLVLAHVDELGGGLELAAVVLGAAQAAVRDDVVAQADLAGLAVDAAVAGEAAVGVVRHDQRHHALARELARNGDQPRLGHSRCALGADVAKDQHVIGFHVQIVAVDALGQVGEALEHHGAAFVLHEGFRRGRLLDDGAAGRCPAYYVRRKNPARL